MERPHVVILGGGFGGLAAARGLAKAPVRVTLVDARNHHLFQPLLYQVATCGLSPGDIAEPIRGVLRRQQNVEVLLDTAEAIDVTGRAVRLTGETLTFDHLVVATGATHSYFGNDGWAPFAPGLKTVEDALEIRRRVLLAYEEAERTDDPAVRQACLTFAVVGGGPTGVELAGALAELARHTLAKDFRRIDPRRAATIHLFEGGPTVLNGFPERLCAKAERQLQDLGVTVHTGARVTAIDAEGLTARVGDEDERVLARTVLWAAGVAGSPLARSLDAPLDRAGRVRVEPDLTIPGCDRISVIGDLAAFEQDGHQLPGIAPVALQGGAHVARAIRRRLAGQATEPFRYRDKGAMATIGRAAAVARVGRLRLSGFLAWLAWLLVHIVFLIGFRNRLVVLVSWAWAYVTYQRGARLITGAVERSRPPSEAAPTVAPPADSQTDG